MFRINKPVLATATIKEIDRALEADQGTLYRSFLKDLLPKAEDAYRPSKVTPRGHLGASMIGKECARSLWYSFHWVKKEQLTGRILRLFNRGHLEEARVVALLKTIGCQVWQFTEDGNQFQFSGYRGHFGGSLDLVLQGIPEMPDVPVLGEIKTHSEKSFTEMEVGGVQKTKFEHYVQMQIYMGEYSLTHALYIAVNKNTDELYLEIIPFDPATYERFSSRAAMLVDSICAPEKISREPSWFKCKMCGYQGVCHGTEKPDINCRTCAHVVPVDNGEWLCTSGVNWIIGKEEQVAGCPNYTTNPSITTG